MLPEDRERFLCQERNRITRFQHQHRGLSFQKLRLPPTAGRKVNLIGENNHVYRGRKATYPLDQLPPEIDETSVDEEALYKEIRDMNFPPVPEQEPLGPSRRIEGKYTIGKRLTYAPIHVDCTEGLVETLVLGKDANIYKGKAKMPSKIELDEKLSGIKRPIQKVLKTSSTLGVDPSLVGLHVNDKHLCYGKGKKALIEIPTTEVKNVLAMLKEKSITEKNGTPTINKKEAADRKRVDFESEVGETSDERLKETEMKDETITEEQREAGTEIPAGSDAEDSVDVDTEESIETAESLSTEETTEESDTESLEEADTGESTETEGSLDSREIKETPGESDVKSLEEADTSESTETEESLNTREIKETTGESDAESLAKTDASESTETKESLDAGKINETTEKSGTE